jgi:hypothetical protein
MAIYTPKAGGGPKKDPLSFIPRAVKSRYINEKRAEWGKILSRFGLALAIFLLIVFFIGKGIWIGGDAAEKSIITTRLLHVPSKRLGGLPGALLLSGGCLRKRWMSWYQKKCRIKPALGVTPPMDS